MLKLIIKIFSLSLSLTILNPSIAKECNDNVHGSTPQNSIPREISKISLRNCIEEFDYGEIEREELCECSSSQISKFNLDKKEKKELPERRISQYSELAHTKFKAGLIGISNELLSLSTGDSVPDVKKYCNLDLIDEIEKCKSSQFKSISFLNLKKELTQKIASDFSPDRKDQSKNKKVCPIPSSKNKIIPTSLFREIQQKAAERSFQQILREAKEKNISLSSSNDIEDNIHLFPEGVRKIFEQQDHFDSVFRLIKTESLKSNFTDSDLKRFKQNAGKQFEDKCQSFFVNAKNLFCEEKESNVSSNLEDLSEPLIKDKTYDLLCNGSCSTPKTEHIMSSLQEINYICKTDKSNKNTFDLFLTDSKKVIPPYLGLKTSTLKELKSKNEIEANKSTNQTFKNICAHFPPPMERLSKALAENNCNNKSNFSEKCMYLRATKEVMEPKINAQIKEFKKEELAEAKKKIKRENPTIKEDELERRAFVSVQSQIKATDFFKREKPPGVILKFLGKTNQEFKTAQKISSTSSSSRKESSQSTGSKAQAMPVEFDSNGNEIPRAVVVEETTSSDSSLASASLLGGNTQKKQAKAQNENAQSAKKEQEQNMRGLYDKIENWGQKKKAKKEKTAKASSKSPSGVSTNQQNDDVELSNAISDTGSLGPNFGSSASSIASETSSSNIYDDTEEFNKKAMQKKKKINTVKNIIRPLLMQQDLSQKRKMEKSQDLQLLQLQLEKLLEVSQERVLLQVLRLQYPLQQKPPLALFLDVIHLHSIQKKLRDQ